MFLLVNPKQFTLCPCLHTHKQTVDLLQPLGPHGPTIAACSLLSLLANLSLKQRVLPRLRQWPGCARAAGEEVAPLTAVKTVQTTKVY